MTGSTNGWRRHTRPRVRLVAAVAVALLAATVSIGSSVVTSLPAGATIPAGVVPATAGSAHTCGLTAGGGVKCWGANASGQLGNSSTTPSSAPVDATGLTSGVTALAAGDFHTCALTSGGGVKCWGSNANGQLGNSSTTSSSTPVTVAGLSSGVTAIAAGVSHSCALLSGGSTRCWGLNSSGQLGNASYTQSTSPVAVVGLTGTTGSITAGGFHTCARRTDGPVQCWGQGTNGQLGLNSTSNWNRPFFAIGGLSATQVTAGRFHTCARTTAGAVQCWGLNGNGQVGDGTTTQRLLPVAVSGLTSGVASIAAGGAHSCALTTAGAVQCWGDNTDGQLGNGSTSQSLVPVPVAGLTSAVTAIAVGGSHSHSCALTETGTMKCWGHNADGQLGNSSTTDESSPVPVTGGTAFLGGPVSLTVAGTRTPAANGAGWSNSSVTVSFTCTGGTAPVDCPSSSVLGEGAAQSVTGTATDAASATASDTVSGINVDLTAPTLTWEETTAPNAAGWYRGNVVVHWLCSDALSGVATCPADSTITGEGDGLSASATAYDAAGNTTTVSSSTVKVDRTAPVTTISPVPLWSAGDLSLTIFPSDGLSGVASTHYSVDGGPVVEGLTPNVVGDGLHTVEYWSVDVAGNVETAHTLSVGIDYSTPTILGSVSPAPNAAGWNRGDVTVSWACGDGDGAGVASCSPPESVGTEGPAQDVTGEVIDLVGNSTTGHVAVSIDKTDPTITFASSSETPASGWFTAAVHVGFTCEDPGGAIASGIAECTDSTTLTDDGYHDLTGTTVDTAGNSASTQATVKIDATPPTISGTVDGLLGGGGWYRGDVTIHWNCDDLTSEVADCPPDEIISAFGTTTVSRTATDNAGNVSATAEVTVSIADGESIAIVGSATPEMNPAGWANTPVTVHFDCTAGAGVASCTEDQLVDTEGELNYIGGEVVDNSDNSATTTVLVNLDFTPPEVEVTGVVDGGTYPLGSVPAPGCAASDLLSGVATQPVLEVTGGSPSGAGTFTATCGEAADNAGNTGSATATYEVVASTGSVSGTVTSSAGGAPVAGARVDLHVAPGLGSATAATAVTDAAGHFELAGVEPGTYHLSAGKAGAFYTAWSPAPVVVTGGGAATADVALTPGASGSGTVTGPSGPSGPSGPVAQATVRVMSGGNPTATRVITDAAGHYTLTGLVAGTYTVLVTAYGFTPQSSAPFTVTSTSSVVPSPDVELAAAPTTTGLGGVVANAVGGAPLGATSVRLWLVGSALTSQATYTTAASNGTWSLAGIPAGTYNVQFAARGAQKSGYFPTSVTVGPGTTPGALSATYNLVTGAIGGSWTPGT